MLKLRATVVKKVITYICTKVDQVMIRRLLKQQQRYSSRQTAADSFRTVAAECCSSAAAEGCSRSTAFRIRMVLCRLSRPRVDGWCDFRVQCGATARRARRAKFHSDATPRRAYTSTVTDICRRIRWIRIDVKLSISQCIGASL